LSVLFVPVLLGQIPRTISYQGVLTDNSGNPQPDGDYSFIFNFYEVSTGGNLIWGETKTLNVSKGLFSTSLGDQTPFSSDVKFDKPYFLGIKVGSEPELSTRIALTSSGYSLTSDNALDVAEGKVVKSLNGLKDAVTIEGSGGTTVTKTENKITISSSTGGGTGILGIQNTNNTLDISDPNGPTATVNLKVPLSLNGDVSYVFTSTVTSGDGVGIWGHSPSGYGVFGSSNSYPGVFGKSISGTGVLGASNTEIGVWGSSSSNTGVYGTSTGGTAVSAFSTDGWGVDTYSQNNYGLNALSAYNYGIVGRSSAGNKGGVYGRGATENNFGVLGYNSDEPLAVYGQGDVGYAGWFNGNVYVNGTFGKSAGSFKIDHPLDPANKFLYHSFVQSPDMMNIYNGNVTTDAGGSASITLPDWFEALNKDFRYQITIIGEEFAQARISQEISNNQFKIKTDKPNIKISWQVTGIRHDAYAEKNRIPIEEFKSEKEHGKYLQPELYGQPKELGINYVKMEEPKVNQQQIIKNPNASWIEKQKEFRNENK